MFDFQRIVDLSTTKGDVEIAKQTGKYDNKKTFATMQLNFEYNQF